MSITAFWDFFLRVEEADAVSEDAVTEQPLVHKWSGQNGVILSSTTIPGTKVWSDDRTLSGGTETLDLTALTRPNLPTVTMLGLKIQFVNILAAAANTQPVVIKAAASNAYSIVGTDPTDGSGFGVIHPGGALLLFGNNTMEDVAAGAKDFIVKSDMTTAAYKILIVAG